MAQSRSAIAANDTRSKNKKIEEIIAALDYLRIEARKSGNEDIYNLIDSTFSICLRTFCIINRYELNKTMPNIGKRESRED